MTYICMSRDRTDIYYKINLLITFQKLVKNGENKVKHMKLNNSSVHVRSTYFNEIQGLKIKVYKAGFLSWQKPLSDNFDNRNSN